jgi:vacuolar-type H+-ATPase subunit H
MGVPADRAAELAAEVMPVLALLDETHAECERIIAAARQDADRITAQARAEAAGITQAASQNARVARDEAAAEVLDQARAEVQEAAAEAGRQALRIRRLARRRLPVLVAAAVGGHPLLAKNTETAAAQAGDEAPAARDKDETAAAQDEAAAAQDEAAAVRDETATAQDSAAGHDGTGGVPPAAGGSWP